MPIISYYVDEDETCVTMLIKIIPAPALPMLNRPLFKMFMAILNPAPTSPNTFSLGMGTFSK